MLDEELTIIPAVCSRRTSLTIQSRQVQWLVFDVSQRFDRVAGRMIALVKQALAGAGLDFVEVGHIHGGLVGGVLPFTRNVLLRRGSRLIARRGGRLCLPGGLAVNDLREVIDGDVEEVFVLYGRRAAAAAGFSWVIGGRDVGRAGRGGGGGGEGRRIVVRHDNLFLKK